MKTLRWLGSVLLVPAVAVALLAWWGSGEIARSGQHMSAWAALLLFGGFACSWSAPKIGVIALYSAFVLQLVRVDCRFDQEGWIAYAAVLLAALTLGARIEGVARRSFRRALLPVGVLVGVFTNLPGLGPREMGGFGLVNGKDWSARFGAVTATQGGTAGIEPLVGLLVWSAAAVALILAAWMVGSSYQARRLQWAAEASASMARADLADSRYELKVTEERDRIAQDVHDITAHSLSVILAQADGAAAQSDDDRTRASLTTIAGSARSALTEVRTLLENLDHTDHYSGSSLEDVARLLEDTRATGREILLESRGATQPMRPAASLAAYRIVQEALTNAIRHGAADGGIRVTLDWNPAGLALTVTSPLDLRGSDDGTAGGRGVIGMQQRARLVGGWLSHGPDAASGVYLVTAFLPITSNLLS